MNSETKLVLYRSVRSVAPQMLLAVVASFLCYHFVDNGVFSGIKVPLGKGEVFTLYLWPLILAVLVIRPFILLFDCKYTITAHHIRTEAGRCSLSKQEMEIPFEHLKGVKINQKLWERLFDVGTIIGWTGIPEVPDFLMRGIRDPHAVSRRLAAKIDEIKIKTGGKED